MAGKCYFKRINNFLCGGAWYFKLEPPRRHSSTVAKAMYFLYNACIELYHMICRNFDE